MSRIKSAATRAPQTTEAASVQLTRFAEVDTQIALIEAAKAETIAQATSKADAELVPLIAERKDLQKTLQPWWEANFEALTGGKRKSIELAGCVIGYRLPPAKVAFAGKDADAAQLLTDHDLNAFVRVRVSIDKEAIAKAIDMTSLVAEDGKLLVKLGFSMQQKEEFFVVRAARPLAIADA